MDDLSNQDQAVELLQQLGLKEYEAKCFVALSRLPQGTARQVSDLAEVPRTRVYDAIRVLETKGFVEIQHTSPQQFRAVPIDEAANTLLQQYESRVDSLRRTLEGVEPVDPDSETEVTHEVWALSGAEAIANRTGQLIDDAEREVVIVLGHAEALDDNLIEHLRAAQERGASVTVGTVAESLQERVTRALPDAEVYVSGLEWLSSSMFNDDRTEITRLLLVDGSVILVSSFSAARDGDHSHEQAVFGRGFDNGLVTIVRRLMATGLVPMVADDDDD